MDSYKPADPQMPASVVGKPNGTNPNYYGYPPFENVAQPEERKPTPALANLCFFTALIAFLAISIVAEIFKLGFFWTSFFGQVALAVTAILFCVLGRYNFRETFSLRKISWKLVALCFLVGLVGQFAVRFPATLNQWAMQIFGPFPLNELIPNPQTDLERVGLFVAAALLAPVCEEILNRGFVQAGYSRLSFGKTIFFVGLLFGLFHLYPFRFAYTFLLGMVLAYLVLVTRSIFSAIACHFGFNIIGGFSPWLTDALERIAPNTDSGRSLIEEASDLNFQTVISTLPISLAAAGFMFWLLRGVTKRMAKERNDLRLGFFGFAYDIRPSQPINDYDNPQPGYSYGRYGWQPDPTSAATVQVQETFSKKSLSPRSLSFWYVSFILIGLFYAFTTFNELAIRMRPATPATPAPKAVVVQVEPVPTMLVYNK
jgi:membrane protease YdiL (CAAX protease family)